MAVVKQLAMASRRFQLLASIMSGSAVAKTLLMNDR